jgi:hypothetical protein
VFAEQKIHHLSNKMPLMFWGFEHPTVGANQATRGADVDIIRNSDIP